MLKAITLDETPFSNRHAEDYDVNFVITPNGQLIAWGEHYYGKLGLGSLVMTKEPELVKGLEDEELVGIKIYRTIALALSRDGNLYMWGRIGDKIVNTPQLIQTFVDLDLQCIDVCQINDLNYMALCKDKHGRAYVYVWGDNTRGELGLDDQAPHPLPTLLPVSGQPTQILSFLGRGFILSSGQVYVFGYVNLDTLVFRSFDEENFVAKPTCIPSLKNHRIEKLYSEEYHMIIAQTAEGCFIWRKDKLRFAKGVSYIHDEEDYIHNHNHPYFIFSWSEYTDNPEHLLPGLGKKLNLPPTKIAAIYFLSDGVIIVSVEGKVFLKGVSHLDNQKDPRINFAEFTDITPYIGRVINMIPKTRYIKTDKEKIYNINRNWPGNITTDLRRRHLPTLKEAWEPAQRRPRSIPFGEALYKEKLADQLTDVSFFRGNKQRLWELYAKESLDLSAPSKEKKHFQYG